MLLLSLLLLLSFLSPHLEVDVVPIATVISPVVEEILDSTLLDTNASILQQQCSCFYMAIKFMNSTKTSSDPNISKPFKNNFIKNAIISN